MNRDASSLGSKKLAWKPKRRKIAQKSSFINFKRSTGTRRNKLKYVERKDGKTRKTEKPRGKGGEDCRKKGSRRPSIFKVVLNM